MSELAPILQAVQEFKDEIKKDITDMRVDIKKIHTVLAGDEFGNNGLVKSHNNTVDKLSKLRDEVKTIKVIGAVLYGIIGLIITTMAYFSKH